MCCDFGNSHNGIAEEPPYTIYAGCDIYNLVPSGEFKRSSAQTHDQKTIIKHIQKKKSSKEIYMSDS